MATPPRMLELKCPKCHRVHWTIDMDSRSAALLGERELSFEERSYPCPFCGAYASGFSVGPEAPPEFLFQPDDYCPMTEQDFGYWLSVFREHVPEDKRLESVVVDWYPGKRDEKHETQLCLARKIDLASEYQCSLSNRSPSDKRIRVCVQGDGEAQFWVGSTVKLDCCYYGFEGDDLHKIRDLLLANESAIREAWDRFSTYPQNTQAKWLAILEWDETV